MLIAHRGARAFAPENTLEAIDKAAALGADAVELDVHLTRDDVLVVVHDEDLTRCTDARTRFPGRGRYHVADFTLDEIRQLDAGAWFAAELDRPTWRRQPFLRSLGRAERARWIAPQELALYRSGAVKLPTLREALERAVVQGLSVVVEIKPRATAAPSATQQVAQLIAELGCAQAVAISAFDHRHLVDIRRLAPGLATAVLADQPIARPDEYVRALDADAYHPAWQTLLRRRGLLGRARPDGDRIAATRRAGVAINVWTVNARRWMRAFIDAGVTGIFTDYPNRVRELSRSPTAGLAEHGQRNG